MEQQERLDLAETIDRLQEENRQLREALVTTDCGRALLQQDEEFSRLLAVSKRIVAELDVPKVLALVAENARQIVNAELMLVPMLNEERDRYTYAAASGADAAIVYGTSHKVNVGMCGWVLQHERSLLFGEASPHWMAEKTPWEAGQQSAVLVPLFGRDGIIGGLSALGKEGGGAFTRHDLDLLTMFANQVSIAIANALLFQQVQREIEERKQAEEELVKSRQDWEDIFQAIGQPAMILSLDHDILAVNHATISATGRKASELISQKCYKVFHADQGSIPPSCCPLVTMLQSQQTHVEEMEVDALGGRFLISCTPVFDQTGKVSKVIHIAVDITEKQRLQEQLNQAQKMEAIGTLAGGIAHDFNNILSAIIGYTDLAVMRTKEPDVLDDLCQIRKAGDRATDLVRQILTFSRKQPHEKTPIQISMVIKDALKLLRASIPTTIEIRQEITSEATILADPTQMHQIVMNLCTNAYQAMLNSGGVLSVTLHETCLDQPVIDFDTELSPGRYVVLSVSDSGCGMDKATMLKIFDPYFTTKGTGKGTGLGLAVVQGIVKSHNGRIAVYSEPGLGTTFNVYLPMIAREAAYELEECAPPMARAHERVMVVDDESTIRDLISQFLSQAGYQVASFANGLEAWRALSQSPNDWDILITDQTMPEMTGDQLALKAVAIRPDLPIILCSGYSTILNSEQAKAARVFACLQKPVGRNKLLSEIFRALSGKS